MLIVFINSWHFPARSDFTEHLVQTFILPMRKQKVVQVKWFTKGQITDEWQLRLKPKSTTPCCVKIMASKLLMSHIVAGWQVKLRSRTKASKGSQLSGGTDQREPWNYVTICPPLFIPIKVFNSVFKELLDNRAQETWLQRVKRYRESESRNLS